MIWFKVSWGFILNDKEISVADVCNSLKIPVKEKAINIIFWQTYQLWRILSGFYAFHAVITRSRVSPQPVSLFLPHILVFYLLAYTYIYLLCICLLCYSKIIPELSMWKQFITGMQERPFPAIYYPPNYKISGLGSKNFAPSERHYIHLILTQMNNQLLTGLF